MRRIRRWRRWKSMRKAVSAKVRRGMFRAVGPLVAALREVKDAEEIATIRTAALLGCDCSMGC